MNNLAAAFSILTIGVYVVISLVHWDFNIYEWSWAGRIIFVVFLLAMSRAAWEIKNRK